ncbi:hypothetical protein FisN_5Lh183 [Fistulifera solaris]|uniref:t-SNARE coiled-coil homology domain-containing protein n=1 Tax=Fistulifera solaris TaxID=1519565 RepID=A0A1Z5JJ03_FISSO|nr:hypothetical protein FisN_5Lh183 [Fistulifera solaris]|eukprot:GAX13916.1 hypothetical protein FisN_5Lh183 [Fistulifera solaris]
MSFQDLSGTLPTEAQQTIPRIVVQQPDDEEPPRLTQKTRSIVLHGKVQQLLDDGGDEELYDVEQVQIQRDAIRKRLQRKSDYSQLTAETQQYQKLVSELSALLDSSGETPEAAWRVRILMISAQETDKLWEKLYNYEKTLLMKKNSLSSTGEEELRTEQTACMKLHRDFKRSHKTLLMAMSLYEKKQSAEISRLGAVGWSYNSDEKEDFYEKVMREREEELMRMNESIHQANDIYKNLAALVEEQQPQIDQVANALEYSKNNVEATVKDYGCDFGFGDQLCSALGIEEAMKQWNPFPAYDDKVKLTETKTADTEALAENEETACTSNLPNFKMDSFLWYDSLETLTNDFIALKNDIIQAGQNIAEQGSKLECVSPR